MSRRLGISILAALAIGAGFVPWPIGAERFLASLRAELPPESGIAIAARKTARLSLLPVPGVTLRDVTVSNRDGETLARAPRVTLRLRLLPLMAGGAQASHIIAYGAEASAHARARDQWRAALTSAEARAFRPHLTLVDARLQLDGDSNILANVNGSLQWQRATRALDLWGHGYWRNELVRVQAAGVPIADGIHAATEQRAQIAIQTPFGALDAEGTLANGRAIGRVQLDMKDAGKMAAWLNGTVPLAGLLDQYTLAGNGTATERGVQLSEATLTVGPNVLKGTLSVAQQDNRKPLISGTLATTALELNTIARAFDAIQDSYGQWNADVFDTRSLQTSDFDIRVSATQARVMKMALRDAALSATLKNGRLDLALGRSSAYGGTLRSRATIARISDSMTEQRIQTTFENVDIGKFSDDMFNLRLLSGTASGQFQLESAGTSPESILNGATGRGTVTIIQGELTGISLIDTVRQAERNQAHLVNLQTGSTRFDSGTAVMQMLNGAVHIHEGRITSVGAQATLEGQINLAKKEYNLNGVVQHPLRPKQWPFAISGPWSKPSARMTSSTSTQRSELSRSAMTLNDSRF